MLGVCSEDFWGDLDITMDGMNDYIWQRRIQHGVRYQKGVVPFPESVEIGLEFNAALERKEKLDESLLSAGVMVDICDFAKTVTKSEKYFLFEMLEFNFDLGVDKDNDKQCYAYASRIHNKIKILKDQIKCKPRRFTETFLLPNQNTIMRFTQPKSGQGYCPKWNKVVDASVLTDGSKNGQSSENQMAESNGAVSSLCVIKRRGGTKLIGDAYPFCKELGVTLIFQSDDPLRQKLDRSLVTNGVMMELLDFSKVLCGTHTAIVCDLVKQNFGLEMDKMQFRMCVSKLMERRYVCINTMSRDAFRKEPFKVPTKKLEQNCRKRKKPDTDSEEVRRLTEASEGWGTLTNGDDDGDLSYMCPVDFETEMQSGTEAKPDKMMIGSCFTGTAAEPASAVALVKAAQKRQKLPLLPPRPNSHHASLFKPCPKTISTLRVSDLMSEDKTEEKRVKDLKQKLWMRRATRSKQILKSCRVNDLFSNCRKIALDFNVGSGNKQKVDLNLLTNHVLWEVYRFANSLKKSAQSFLLEILGLNFNFVPTDEMQQRNLISYMMSKEKILQSNPDRWKMEFLSRPFRFPEVYNIVDATSECHAGMTQELDVEPPASATNQQMDVEPHKYCSQLGLDLWSTEQRLANQKLDLNVLTSGAVFEIFSFVRELCGEVHEIVNDILEHNFEVDLRSGGMAAAKVIQRWCTTHRFLIKNRYKSPNAQRWLNTVVPLNGDGKIGPKPLTRNHREDLDTEDVKPSRQALDAKMQQVKKVNSYCICKKIGLDLQINRKSEPKKKLDLQLLTRGALLEIHQYVEQNSKRYVPSLYEILEYNFDLSPLKHGKVEFAWSIASKAIVIADKISRKGDYLNKVFELPFEVSQCSQIKEEPEDEFSEPDLHDNSGVMFVRELKAVDIEVEIE